MPKVSQLNRRCSGPLICNGIWLPTVLLLQTPVRAVVLPLLQHEAALQLHTAVRHALQQLLADESIWYQDPTLMHATIYHASDYKV